MAQHVLPRMWAITFCWICWPLHITLGQIWKDHRFYTICFRHSEMRGQWLEFMLLREQIRKFPLDWRETWQADHLIYFPAYHIVMITEFPKHTLAAALLILWHFRREIWNVISWGKVSYPDMQFVVNKTFWFAFRAPAFQGWSADKWARKLCWSKLKSIIDKRPLVSCVLVDFI